MACNFDEIRPFTNQEVNGALKRITADEKFVRIIKYIYPNVTTSKIIKGLHQVKSIEEFQYGYVADFITKLINETTEGVFHEGFKEIDKDGSYVYLTNHRDIILDSAFLNQIMFLNNYNTTEIAIGSNLLIYPWITDLVKLNRSFIVKRGLSVRQILENSILMSKYIHDTILNRKTSLWIAQREGRTKNGDDRTQSSVLKMLGIAGGTDLIESLRKINIRPVAISYEYEPCDLAKVKEQYIRNKNNEYTKTSLEDLKSMGMGLMNPKGKVNLYCCKPLNCYIDEIKKVDNKNEQAVIIADFIDKKIHENYQLFKTNYIAYDLLTGSDKYAERYTREECEAFQAYVDEKLENEFVDRAEHRRLFYELYANPVINKEKVFEGLADYV